MLTVLTACTPDYREMVAENYQRCRAFGYGFHWLVLDKSDDLLGDMPPCTFKPELIATSLEAEGITAWIDADAVVVRTLDPLESLDFDVAVTLREPDAIGASNPTTGFLNAGVVFFRPTAADFTRRWAALTRQVGNDQLALNQMVGAGWTIADWRSSYGRTFRRDDVSIHILPATEWNFWHWPMPTAAARILHFKHGFRAANKPNWWKNALAAADRVRA
jgi:hypothetical protein